MHCDLVTINVVVFTSTSSSVAVCHLSRKQSSCVRPRNSNIRVPACVSQPTLCPDVPAIHVWHLSRQFRYVCPGVPDPTWVSRRLIPSSLSRRLSRLVLVWPINTHCDQPKQHAWLSRASWSVDTTSGPRFRLVLVWPINTHCDQPKQHAWLSRASWSVDTISGPRFRIVHASFRWCGGSPTTKKRAITGSGRYCVSRIWILLLGET